MKIQSLIGKGTPVQFSFNQLCLYQCYLHHSAASIKRLVNSILNVLPPPKLTYKKREHQDWLFKSINYGSLSNMPILSSNTDIIEKPWTLLMNMYFDYVFSGDRSNLSSSYSLKELTYFQKLSTILLAKT